MTPADKQRNCEVWLVECRDSYKEVWRAAPSIPAFHKRKFALVEVSILKRYVKYCRIVKYRRVKP